MAVTYKDIDLLSQKSSVAGTEKLPVSDTQYITPNQIAGLVSVSGKADKVSSATNGDFAGLDSNGNLTDSGKKDSDFVHKTGNESIAGNKTFSGNITLSGENKGITLDQSGQYILNTIEDGFDWIQDEAGDSVQDYLDAKQATLVSGTNIKTINNESILGSGNITVGGGGDTSSCVHKTGDETVGGDKTFTDDIIVGDASNIKYSGGGGGGGFTRGYASVVCNDRDYLEFTGITEAPAAFIVTLDLSGDSSDTGIIAVIGDSTGTHAVYSADSTHQHNYTASCETFIENGFGILAATTGFISGATYKIVYYYGSGTLTFRTATVSPGSGATSVTFTDANLTAVPAFYATMLESQVNNESYRRVAYYTNEGGGSSATPMGVSFFSSQIHNTTSSFSVSYSNGLVINSGGTNAGGYFHNPGTYTLYYLMASDIGGGGGGSYNDLAEELADMASDISGLNTALSGKEATSNKVTSVSAQSTDTQYPSAKLLYDQLALKQNTITVSTSEPTAYQGNNGDIWFVVSS